MGAPVSTRMTAMACWALALTLTTAARAQEADKETLDIVKTEAADKDVFKFDFAVPSSPVLTLLGIDKDKVTQSNSLKPFILSLPDVLSSSKTGQAIAVDVSPAWLFVKPGDRTYDKYQSSGTRPLWFRTRAAVALYEGAQNDDASKQKASRASLGLSTSFLNSSDPLLARLPGSSGESPSAWATCVMAAAPQIRASLPGPPMSPEGLALEGRIERHDSDINRLIAELADASLSAEARNAREAYKNQLIAEKNKLEAELKKVEETTTAKARVDFAKTEAAKLIPLCMKVADLAAKLGDDLDFGGGAVWDGNPGELSGFKDPSAVVWASYRHAFGIAGPKEKDWASLKRWYDDFDHWYMIGASVRVGVDESVATGDKTTPKVRADTYTGWVGLERYSETNRFAFQVGKQKTATVKAADKAFDGTRNVYLASYDQKVTEGGLWLSLSYGEAQGAGSLKDDKTARVTFTFAAPDARKIFGGP